MNALAFIGIALIMLLAIGWSAWDFLQNLACFIAPDNEDQRAIEQTLGGASERGQALKRRVGRGRHWRDAAIGLSGLLGMLTLYWIWFG